MSDPVDHSVMLEDFAQTKRFKQTTRVAVGIVMDSEQKLLLSYRPKNQIQGGFWEFAGGIIEEESEYSALQRELFEELGIKVTQAEAFTEVSYQLDKELIILQVWLIKSYSGTPSGIENQRIQWVAIDQTEQVPMTRPNRIILDRLITHQHKNYVTSIQQNNHLDIELFTWSEIREEIHQLNPSFAAAIDADEVDDEFKIVKAHYGYGNLIMNMGKFCLPSLKGESVSLCSDFVSADLAKMLSYSNLPTGIILGGSTELCFEQEHAFVTMNQFNRGEILGLFNALSHEMKDPAAHIMNLYSGIRSVFMLPKISDAHAHARIVKEFNIKKSPPSQYHEHFHVFRELSLSVNEKFQWKTTILFFTKEWFETSNTINKTYHFKRYLEKAACSTINQYRQKIFLDLFWHFFINRLHEKHKKPPNHILESVRQLLSILTRITPGFGGLAHNDQKGPFRTIQKIYLEVYRLTSAPTIIGANYFDPFNHSPPVYHSMRLPLMLDAVPRNRMTESLITDLVQMQSLYSDFYSMSLSDELNIDNTIIEQALRRTKVDYFHSNPDATSYYRINPSNEIPLLDPELIKHSGCTKMKFADTSSFIRCCVRLMNKTWQNQGDDILNAG